MYGKVNKHYQKKTQKNLGSNYIFYYSDVSRSVINISTERLKWRPMLWQMRESMLHPTLHVRVANDTQKIQSSDWPKQRLRCDAT